MQPKIIVSTLIVFCEQYSSLPFNSRAVSQAVLDTIRNQLASRCFCTPPTSISSLTVAKDYKTGRVVVQFLLETISVPGAPYGAGHVLAHMINNGSLLVPVQVQGVTYFELKTNCPGPNIFLWTDYGPCPVRPCENGAVCAKRGSSPRDYYCSCREGFTGRYCESKIVDLSPLIILPIFFAVLMLLMLCLCCCACCCWVAGEQIIEEVIEEEETSRVEEKFYEMPEPMLKLPQQTYDHMLGRSFGVAFNDRSFLRPDTTSSATDRYYYGSYGNRVTADDIPAIHISSRSELAGPITVTADVERSGDGDQYYRSVGRQNALAFNRHAFSGRAARSVIRSQPF